MIIMIMVKNYKRYDCVCVCESRYRPKGFCVFSSAGRVFDLLWAPIVRVCWRASVWRLQTSCLVNPPGGKGVKGAMLYIYYKFVVL